MMTRKDMLISLYGVKQGKKVCSEINNMICGFRKTEKKQKNQGKIKKPIGGKIDFEPDQTTAVLITYGDIIRESGHFPLQILHKFLSSYVKDFIPIIHILPFYPYSSDDGFSVIDFRQVDDALGTWQDIDALSIDFKLCFDAVFNHTSVQHRWFKHFLEDKNDYYIALNGDEDLSQVIRPRTSALVSEFPSLLGIKKVWTTFSKDQVDLNFKSIDLLLKIVHTLLFYLFHGVSMVRLDAIAFLWKESGTTCLHLEKTHLIVKLFRSIVDEAMPGTLILTETNVPHEDNISYFSDGDEAHMVYQFPLAPLTAHGILRENPAFLQKWASGLLAYKFQVQLETNLLISRQSRS